MLDSVPPPAGDDLAVKKWLIEKVQELTREVTRLQMTVGNRS